MAVTFLTSPKSLPKNLLSMLNPPSLDSMGSLILVCKYNSPPLLVYKSTQWLKKINDIKVTPMNKIIKECFH